VSTPAQVYCVKLVSTTYGRCQLVNSCSVCQSVWYVNAGAGQLCEVSCPLHMDGVSYSTVVQSVSQSGVSTPVQVYCVKLVSTTYGRCQLVNSCSVCQSVWCVNAGAGLLCEAGVHYIWTMSVSQSFSLSVSLVCQRRCRSIV